MFTKFISILLVFSIATLQAQDLSNKKIKDIFDDLTYYSEVEWDQKDVKSMHSKMDSTYLEIKKLQDEGLSNQELFNASLAFVKTQDDKNKILSVLKTVEANKMSQEDARKFVGDVVKSSYSKGASWNGDAVMPILAVTAGIALITLFIYAIVTATPCETNCSYSGSGSSSSSSGGWDDDSSSSSSTGWYDDNSSSSYSSSSSSSSSGWDDDSSSSYSSSSSSSSTGDDWYDGWRLGSLRR